MNEIEIFKLRFRTFVVFFFWRGALLASLCTSFRASCAARTFLSFLFALLFLFRFNERHFLSGHQTVTATNLQGNAGLFWCRWGRGGCSGCLCTYPFLLIVQKQTFYLITTSYMICFEEQIKVRKVLNTVENCKGNQLRSLLHRMHRP